MNDRRDMSSEKDKLLQENDFMHLKVRTKEGSELEVELAKSGIVNDLKQAIISRLELVDKHVRLIFSGKMLEPPNAPLSLFKLNEGSYVHAVITNNSQHNAASSQAPPIRSVPTVDMGNLRGLDTLMLPAQNRSTLSQDEVASLRAYFRDEIREYAEDNLERGPDEPERDFIYRSEEEWMAAQDATSEFRLNLYGRSIFNMAPGILSIERMGVDPNGASSGARALQISYENDLNGSPMDQGSMRDFFYGLIMGFGCGYMMLFCMWDRNISQRQKMGILVGMVLSLLLSMMMQEHQSGGDSKGLTGSSATGTDVSGGIGPPTHAQTQPDLPVIDGLGGAGSSGFLR
eukprot:CAMPEP_0170388842 /NCGR_PEP_ID=MMETSP0117_2-20130122/18305_1 /TAXON_ID=400756 /ORGANISM="Durinskia baltica, Strain CSIRO CS-38" /LENGTH=344 /DNA_ID=CAMNT_0010644801 /DNA_START=52 /DNA_END=1086 /DNA_ORIENTATION=+